MYQRLYFDFFSERLVIGYQQTHHELLKAESRALVIEWLSVAFRHIQECFTRTGLFWKSKLISIHLNIDYKKTNLRFGSFFLTAVIFFIIFCVYFSIWNISSDQQAYSLSFSQSLAKSQQLQRKAASQQPLDTIAINVLYIETRHLNHTYPCNFNPPLLF